MLTGLTLRGGLLAWLPEQASRSEPRNASPRSTVIVTTSPLIVSVFESCCERAAALSGGVSRNGARTGKSGSVAMHTNCHRSRPDCLELSRVDAPYRRHVISLKSGDK